MDDFLAEANTLSGTSLGQIELSAGDTLGRYELLVPIGEGGMGAVWAARLNGTRGFRKLVAIKTILRPLVSVDSEQMLFQEAVLASQIHHQNVAQTFELAEHDGILYLVMELVPGEPISYLRKAALQGGGIPLKVVVNLVGQVCRGLKAAHELCDDNGNRIGLVHRDISPPNIMVTPDGTAKIVDFGVATTTTAADVASLKGKFSNLAPEQLRGEPVDARADVFATGILLYSLTVGRHPFRAADDHATVLRILSAEPAARPSALAKNYPRALESVVMHALEKDRTKRIQSAAELLDALVRAVPDAFGPTADAVVAEFVQGLMKGRLEERRSALRVAEEFAERASQLPPMPSVAAQSATVTELPSPLSLVPTAATHPGRTEVAPRRVSRLGLVAIITVFGALGLAIGSIRFRGPEPSRVHLSSASGQSSETTREQDLVNASRAPLITRTQDPLSASGPAGYATPGQPRTAANAHDATTALPAPDARHARTAAANVSVAVSSSSRGASAQKNREPPERSREEGPETSASAGPVPAAYVLPLENRKESMASLASVTGAKHAVLPPLQSSPKARASGSPLLLTSKIGHKQLRIDPTAETYRPRIPHALARSGHSWETRVNICVNASGAVSKVDITASASPALDNPISQAISRWRYDPLLVGGEAQAFCYPLTYEFDGA